MFLLLHCSPYAFIIAGGFVLFICFLSLIANRCPCASRPLRVPLTSKRGNKDFYKGKGAPTMGERTSKGILGHLVAVRRSPDL
jgi:hypothetical protein